MISQPAKEQSALAKVNVAYQMGSAALAFGDKALKRWQERTTFSVTVGSDDPLYQEVHEWLLGEMPRQQKVPRALFASSGSNDGMLISSDEETPPATIRLSYDDKRMQTIVIDGHQIKVDITKVDDASLQNGRLRMAPDTIKFLARSEVARKAVLAKFDEIVASRGRGPKKPVLWLLNSWGSWSRRRDLPLRTFDSVVLRAGQAERLRGDLTGFLQAEEAYVRRGIPWHRGYLLHGPPGTGKTSIVKALANEFGLDLWYAPLNDLTKDANLLSLLAEVRPRSILLLEDVDSFSAATDRKAEQGEITTSGLLNALDGVATPHGLITVLTTNHRQAIDPALLRPGRVDLSEEIGYPDLDQIDRLFRVFYGRAPSRRLGLGDHVSTADLMETFKTHMDDPEAAEALLVPVSAVSRLASR